MIFPELPVLGLDHEVTEPSFWFSNALLTTWTIIGMSRKSSVAEAGMAASAANNQPPIIDAEKTEIFFTGPRPGVYPMFG